MKCVYPFLLGNIGFIRYFKAKQQDSTDDF